MAYFANPATDNPETTDVRDDPQSTTPRPPADEFDVRWYDPASGVWLDRERVDGGRREFTTPTGGNRVLTLERLSVSVGTWRRPSLID
ncbi:hypothetical protein ACFQL4_09640 [Halosimplex aquaticum]